MGLRFYLIFIIIYSIGYNCFAQEVSQITIGKISIEGNKITHKHIIMRELEFAKGETMQEEALNEKIIKSRQNLLNRSLFNFVNISKNCNNKFCDIVVSVTERWYIWPVPLVEYADRNINIWWENKDWSRINYGVDLRVENFRGRMENLNIIVKGGYDQLYKLKWQIPYLTKNQIFGMGFEGGYQLNHEIPIATKNNRSEYYKTDDAYARKLGFASANLTFRPKYNFLHQIGLNFTHINIADSVLFYNPNYAFSGTEFNFFSINYIYKHDFRDYKPYPLKGYYFDIQIMKLGLGIISKEVNEFIFDVNIDHYFNIWKRWNFAYGLHGGVSFTNNHQAYFLAGGIGKNGFDVRGYELYIIDGQNIGTLKTNIKYTIIPKKYMKIKWIKTEKFSKVFYALYANLFFDMGYAQDKFWHEKNPLNNHLLWGTGIGLDFITYYDIVIRLEHTINKQGRMGFYISLVAPI